MRSLSSRQLASRRAKPGSGGDWEGLREGAFPALQIAATLRAVRVKLRQPFGPDDPADGARDGAVVDLSCRALSERHGYHLRRDAPLPRDNVRLPDERSRLGADQGH